MNPLLVLLLGGGAIGGLLWFANSGPGGGAPQPSNSGPAPIPNPANPTNADLLRQQLAALLLQAQTNPGSLANPTSIAAMTTLASELDRAGLTAEAATLRNVIAQAQAQLPPQGPVGPIGPQPPLDPVLQNQLDALLANAQPGVTNPLIVTDLANRIETMYPGFYQPQIQQLRALAVRLPPV